MTEEVPILPEIKPSTGANAKSEKPEKAEKWLLHNKDAPPVPPPIYEWSPQLKAKVEEDLADKPETYFDRRRETLENKQPEPTIGGMVPLKEVLAKHPANPEPRSVSTRQDRLAGLTPVLQTIKSTISTPLYRRPMIIGAAGGMVVLLGLLVLQVS
ncbi:MAG: hypothetical protein V4702_01370 [Patescibacteria group bacterium]